MSENVTVGVVGGYGATGKVVVSELWNSTNWQIRIGGRDPAQAEALAAEFDPRVSAAPVDVLNANSLDDFCRQCSIVVNCAGPICILQDRVAQSALRNRCHYIDPAGMSFVKERMLPHDRQIRDLGLCFAVSAGWMPGLTEVLPVYAHALARSKMDVIDSVTVYFGDSGEWSTNALRDAAFFLRLRGLRLPTYCRKGKWTRAKLAAGSSKADLGNPVGSRFFSMISHDELMEVASRLNDCDVFAYSYLSGFRIALAGTLVMALPLPLDLSVRLLRFGFRRSPLPVGGFVAVKVQGQSQERSLLFTAQVVYDKHRDYWIHGLVLATVARMVSERTSVRPGVHFLSEAVAPAALIAELRNAGIEQTESLETCQ